MSNRRLGISSVELVTMLGDGDYFKGMRVLKEIVSRVAEARAKHDWSGKNNFYGLDAIMGEALELEYAVRSEPPSRQHEEALDVCATTIRFLGQEWRQ